MIYEFMDKDGTVYGIEQSMHDCTGLGDWIYHGDVLVQRILSMPTLSVQSDFDVTNYQVSRSHPAIDAMGLQRDQDGFPKLSGIRQIEKFTEMTQRMHAKDTSVQAFSWDKE